MSRKEILKKMSSLIGNAAAHRALEPASAFSLREAWLYETQAAEEAEMRTWNEIEISLFRDRALRYAENVIKKRSRSHRGRSATEINAEATRTIDEFIEKELRK
jgi:hypothetical protein